MTRIYTLKKRAESQAETRRRIVEAAAALHGTVGPSATTVSMVAERAGVQRHTFYAHFPDERSLLLACSGLTHERDPAPDAAPWRAIEPREERLRTGLDALYAWYECNEQLTACVLRDAQTNPLVREINEHWLGQIFGGYHEVLGQGLSAAQHAVLTLALSYHTWRTLAREAGLDRAAAVEAMVRAVGGAANSE